MESFNLFPISDYYKKHIKDAITISNTGQWWTAIFLINDPKNGKPFISMYRWQKTQGGWKVRKRFSFSNKEKFLEIIKVLNNFAGKINWD